MILNRMHTTPGTKKKKKRIGRGNGSGHGKTSGRGNKGLMSRSGGGLRYGFEGGQMPLIRRIPKRGFTGPKKHVYQVVNIAALKKVKADSAGLISPEELIKAGLIRDSKDPVKILGDGDISKAYILKAHAFSKNAREKIEKAGGKTEVIKK